MAPKEVKEVKDDKEKKEKKEKSEKKEKKEKKEDADGDKKEKKSRIKDTGGMSLWESTGDAANISFGGPEPQDKRDKERQKEKETAKHVAEGKGLMKASDVIKETMGKMNEEKVKAKKEATEKAAKEAKEQAKADANEAEGAAEEREEFQIMDNSGLGNFMDKIQVTDIMKSTVAEASSSSSSRCQISASTKRGDPIFIGKKTAFLSLGDFSFVKGFVYIRSNKDEQGFNLKLNRPSVVYVCHSKRPNEDDGWLQKWEKCQMQLPEFDESAAEVVVARKKSYKSPDSREVTVPRPPPGIETVLVFVAPDFHADVFTGSVQLTEEEALEKKRIDGAAARAARSGETGAAGKAGTNKKEELTATVDEKLAEVLAKVEKGEKLSSKEKKTHEKHLEKTKVWTNEQDEHDAQTGTAGLNAFSISMVSKNDPPANGDAIVCEGFTISAPKQVLFDNVDLTIVQGKRYGILGPNGQGKTTLLRHLAARELPIPLNWDVILVEQEAKASNNTAVEEVLSSDMKTADLLKREAELIKQLEDADDEVKGKKMDLEDMQKAQQELSMIAADLEASGADSAEARVRKILCGLGFTNHKPEENRFSMDRPVQEFSGGWRMRISLAKALFLEPKLLMLDEPTNHLDLDAVLWLDRYLSEQYPHAVIVVSHDADFLDSIVTDILHLENKKLKHYRGDYTAFRKMHAQNKVGLDKEYKKQQDELKALKKKGKTNDEAHDLIKKKFNIDNLDNLMEKQKDYVVKFTFHGHGKDQSIGGVNMTEVAFSYNGAEPWLLEDCEMGVDCASRIAIVGPNGAGKSTLLNLMMQTLEPCLGDVSTSKGLRVKQYHQHFEELLPMERDPVDYLVNEFNLSPPERARGVLGQFGLPGASHFTKIGNLSGGQKARVAFSALMLLKPHIMVLDEPTNHLDIESVEALTDAIKNFNGGLVLVTHDARLITEIDCDIWVVEDGGCYKFEKYKNQEGFEGYRDKVIAELEERQLEVERNEKKRREARIKQRAKHFTEEQALAAKKQWAIDEVTKKEEAEKQALKDKVARDAKAYKAEQAAKEAAKEEAKEESSEEEDDEEDEAGAKEEKAKETEAKRKAAEKEAEAKRKEAEAAAKTKASKPAAPSSGGSKAALRAELEAEKKSALRKRAVADGVDEEELEEADDADDPKEAFIELILAKACGEGEEEENGEVDNSALREELEALKKSALRKRATAADVAEEDLEEADDDDDPKEAFIKLILAAEGGKGKGNNEEATAAAKKKAEAEEAKKKEAETKKKEEAAKKAAKEAAAKKKPESDNDDDEADEDEDEDEDDLIALAMQRKALAKKQKAVVEDEEEEEEQAAPPPESAKKDDFSDDDKKKGKKGKKAPPAPKGKPKAKGKAPAGKNPWEESDDDDQQNLEDAEESEKDAEEEDNATKKGGKKVAAKTKPNKKKEGGAEKKAREAREAAGEDEEPDDGPKKPQGKKGKKGGSDDEADEPAPKAKSKSKAKKGEEEEDEPAPKAKGKKGKAADADDEDTKAKGKKGEEEEDEAAPKAKGKKGKKGEQEEEEEVPEPATKGKKGKQDDEEDSKPGRKKEKGPKKKVVEGDEKAETNGAEAAAAPPPSKPKKEDADDVDALVVSGEVASCDPLRKKGNFLLSITVGSRQVSVVASSEVEVGKKVKVALEGATLENGKTVKREKIAGEWSEGSLI